MALRVTLAGRVGIEVDGGEVTAAGLGRPGRLALAYLTCQRHRAVPRDELAEVLWGDERPSSWDQMLRGVTLKLRGLLAAAGLDPSPALTTELGALRLHLPPDATVDVEEAAAALAGAEASLAAGYPGSARAQASAAVAVASRQFAPTTAGTWVERRQAELAELHLRALEALARAALAEGDWPSAIAAAEEAVAREPFRESAYLCLMDAHAGAGNRGEALRAYSRCRDVLVEELGVDPSPPTEAAYLRLLGDAPAAAGVTSATALPLPPALVPAPGSFLVGRTDEMEILAAALKRAGVEGRQGVLVGGEPGAGKTSLVAALARSAHAGGARVLYGRCDEELALPYQPFAQALGHYVANAPTAELKAHVAARGGTLTRLVPELNRRLPEATPPPTTNAEADRWALFEAVADVLARAAADTTVVLVLDDLHWAAPPTLALLRHLLADAGPTAMVVLGTYRHTDTAPDSALAATLADLRRAPAVERIALGGLDADGVADFVEAAGNTEEDATALARALHAHTAGNPFFVGELLRHLAETGGVFRRDGAWSYWSDGEGTAIPEGVREVVSRRIGRLTLPARQALRLGSVFGAEFDLPLLERAVADGDSVVDALEECVAARLLVELPKPAGRHQFVHALVREVVYDELSGIRRARLHRRVGEILESVLGPDDDARLPALAHHFSEAAAAGCATKAADYALAAARQAAGQAGWELAAAQLDRGLDALSAERPVDLERQCHLLLMKAEVLGNAAQTDLSAVWATSLQAAAAARALSAPRLLARAATAYNHPRQPGGEIGRQLCEEALAALGPADLGPRAEVLVALAQTGTIGETAEAVSIEALQLARRSEDPVALKWAFRLRAATLLGTPALAELRALADEMVAAPWADALTRSVGVRFRLGAHLMAGDRVGFDGDAAEIERLASELRLWLHREQVAVARVTSAVLDGRFDDVDGLIDGLRRLHPEGLPSGAFEEIRGHVLFEQGRLRELSALPAPWSGMSRPLLRARGALVEAELGDAAAAARELAAMTGDLDAVDRTRRAATAAALAEVAFTLRDGQAAPALREALLPFANTVLVIGFAARCLGPADHFLGLLATVLERHAEAEAHFLVALRLASSLASPPLVARTQLAYARLLLTRCGPGDAVAAATLLGSCRASARRRGMGRLASQAEAALAILEGKT